MTLSTTKPMTLTLMALLTASLVAANSLQIAGAYYDPVQAESGRNIHSPHKVL